MSATALQSLDSRLAQDRKSRVPTIASFREFLQNHAQVKCQDGSYVAYSFNGRDALGQIVDTLDHVLGSHTQQPLKDSSISICGGAQFGKTILVLNLMAFLTGGQFRNAAYYLPTGDLVDDIVDGKFRPDVIDQIDWFGDLWQTVKQEKGRNRKSVDRKGMFKVTDGQRSANGYVKGMARVPTSISADAVILDEMDDIPGQNAKYASGRMTASALRLQIKIGTQRIHGAGQNKEFREGSQGVIMLINQRNGRQWNPEDNFPQIIRMAINGIPHTDDPQLTLEGDFRSPDQPGVTVSQHRPDAYYYLADPDTGEVLDRNKVQFFHKRPERIEQRKWSFRISQLGIPAIDLTQIVGAWADAVKDPEQMVVFCCDRLAVPKSTDQALSPQIIERARSMEAFDLSLTAKEATTLFAGIDTGERCWFVAREVENKALKRIRWAEQVSGERIVSRAIQLFEILQLSCLLIDAHPLYNEARQIAWAVNSMIPENQPVFPGTEDPTKLNITFPGGVVWNGPMQRWENLRGAVVNFTLKPGQGIRHLISRTQDGYYYPEIQANRDESIQRAINELLTPEEQVIEVIDGNLRKEPSMRLPRKIAGSRPIVEILEEHLVIGSEKEMNNDGSKSFVRECENHLLLCDAYSALAETIGGNEASAAVGIFNTFGTSKVGSALTARRERNCAG